MTENNSVPFSKDLLEILRCPLAVQEPNGNEKGKLKLFVSDLPARFEVVSKRFLGKDISNVEKIHLDTV